MLRKQDERVWTASHLAQDRKNMWALVNSAMNVLGSKKY
jgi:hypothetical protein